MGHTGLCGASRAGNYSLDNDANGLRHDDVGIYRIYDYHQFRSGSTDYWLYADWIIKNTWPSRRIDNNLCCILSWAFYDCGHANGWRWYYGYWIYSVLVVTIQKGKYIPS